MSTNDLLQWVMQRGMQIRLEHIEQMVAAYFEKTDIPPDQVELIEEQDGYKTKWYLRRRDPLKTWLVEYTNDAHLWREKWLIQAYTAPEALRKVKPVLPSASGGQITVEEVDLTRPFEIG